MSPKEGNSVWTVNVLRSSIRDKFKDWNQIGTFTTNDLSGKTFDDYYIESGVLYKYAIQPTVLQQSESGEMVETKAPLGFRRYGISGYEGVWIVGKDKVQIKFDYNPKVGTIKNVINDTVVETLGNEYPFVIRASKGKYKQFTYDGTLTVDMDIERKLLGDNYYQSFTDLDTPLDEEVEEIYKKFSYEAPSPMGDYKHNYVQERELRNKLNEWLCDGSAKLFKSDTEGLIICRLTNINLEPRTELGRVIYDVSFNVIQIADTTRDNLVKFGLLEEV